MRTKALYLFELAVILPMLPLLKYQGTKIRKRVSKLKPQSEKLISSKAESKPDLLIIGESTAAGMGATCPENSIGGRLFDEIGKDFNIINYGKNGLKASQLETFLELVIPVQNASLHTVVILIGANDCFNLTPPQNFFHALKTFIGKLSDNYQVTDIILISIPPVNKFPAIPSSIKFLLGWHWYILNIEMKNLKKVFPTLMVKNMVKVFPDSFFSSDGIHPSDLGYASIAKEIASITKKVTPSRGHLIQKIEPQTKPI